MGNLIAKSVSPLRGSTYVSTDRDMVFEFNPGRVSPLRGSTYVSTNP